MMRLLLRLLTVTALVLSGASFCAAGMQEESKPSPPPATSTEDDKPSDAPATPMPRPQFFAGTLTTVDAGQIVVSRRLVGKAPESRTFLLRPKTKTNHALKPKQRVTVRYQHLPEGDIALEVLVRQQPHAARPS